MRRARAKRLIGRENIVLGSGASSRGDGCLHAAASAAATHSVNLRRGLQVENKLLFARKAVSLDRAVAFDLQTRSQGFQSCKVACHENKVVAALHETIGVD